MHVRGEAACAVAEIVSRWMRAVQCNQFGEDFGSTIEQGPFCKAITLAQSTVLLVDRNADSLSRSWCGVEIFYTNKRDKALQMYTSQGLVGEDVTSGPLFEAVKSWDVRTTEASQDSDRRMILNYFCLQDELDGILKDCDGNPILDNRKCKSLENSATVPECGAPLEGEPPLEGEAPLRQNEAQSNEYVHEAALFAKHHASFNSLNSAVR